MNIPTGCRAAYSPSTYTLSGVEVSYLPSGIYWNGTIPNNPDTDQDELKDGKEINGYDLVGASFLFSLGFGIGRATLDAKEMIGS